MSKVASFLKVTRANVVFVMIVPVALAAVGALTWNHTFHPLLFLLTVIGAAAIHLFSNMINDLWDYRNEVDTKAQETEGSISTNSGFLTQGIWSEQRFAAVTWILFAVALVCGLILAYASGYMILVYGVLGALIAYYYVAPPIRFGYRGKGYSEVAILLAFGVLPVLGSYYVQTSQYDNRALLVSLPVGILTTLVLFNHHFLHWRADKAAGKNTLVVVFGESRALRFSAFMVILAYLSLILAIFYGALPVYALFALLTAFPLIRLYRSLRPTNPSEAYLPLMGASVNAAVSCGAVMILALLVQWWMERM
ncbi:prenyltransferase [Paenibacillus sp. CC-CFT747]|nr:prenyltransferase [Paenibacillus sp. CC-CFT747]